MTVKKKRSKRKRSKWEITDKVFINHERSIKAVCRKLEREGWDVVPFVHKRQKGKPKGIKKRYIPKTGIVDLVAVRLAKTKISKKEDKPKIILFQIKSGSARLDDKELSRLKRTPYMTEVYYNVAEVRDGKVKFWWDPNNILK